MFSALQSGSTIYLMEKSTLTLKVGQVQNISFPKPVISPPYPMGNNTTIDITVVADNETITLPNIPSNLAVTTTNGIVVSETRDGMCAEVESILRMTQQVIDNYEAHKRTVQRCKQLLRELNPSIAEKQAQQEEIASLKNQMDEIKALLKKALNNNRTTDK